MKITPLILSLLAIGIANSGAALAWMIGVDDTNGGGGPQRINPEPVNYYGTVLGTTTLVQEGNGPTNPLPGVPNSPATNQQADDDYYFPGDYSNQVNGGSAYATVGIVGSVEAGMERAITNGDNGNRIHFNFSGIHNMADIFTFTFQMLDINDNGTGTGHYDFDVNVNGFNIGNFSHTPGTVGVPFVSNTFTLADVNGTPGAPDDNYVELIASNPGTSARWSNFDYFRMDFEPVPEPSGAVLGLLAACGLLLRRRR